MGNGLSCCTADGGYYSPGTTAARRRYQAMDRASLLQVCKELRLQRSGGRRELLQRVLRAEGLDSSSGDSDSDSSEESEQTDSTWSDDSDNWRSDGSSRRKKTGGRAKYAGMSEKRLQSLCRQRGLTPLGRKSQLVRRLIDADVDDKVELLMAPSTSDEDEDNTSNDEWLGLRTPPPRRRRSQSPPSSSMRKRSGRKKVSFLEVDIPDRDEASVRDVPVVPSGGRSNQKHIRRSTCPFSTRRNSPNPWLNQYTCRMNFYV